MEAFNITSKIKKLGAHRTYLLVTITLAIGVVSLLTANMIRNKREETSLKTPSALTATTCGVSFAIATPTPTPTSTPTPTPPSTYTSTPTPTVTSTPTVSPTPGGSGSSCQVYFDTSHMSVCWKDPIANVPVNYTVASVPSTGGPYYLQTDWYITYPEGEHHYKVIGPVYSGQKGTLYFDWPGYPTNSLPKDGIIVEVHLGLNIVDKYGTPITPNCSHGIDVYASIYNTSCQSGGSGNSF